MAMCAIGCGRIGYEPIDDPRQLPEITEAHPTGPTVGAPWQIQLAGSVDTSLDVPFYVIDMDTSAPVLTALHGAGRFVGCYFSGGTWESFRDDASVFPASALGNTVAGYPDERWVDVRRPEVRAIMAARIDAAAQRGCDGILASGLAEFSASSGFALTRDDQVDYDRWLAATAHATGRAIGLEDGDAALARDLAPSFDWIVVWECLDATCNPAPPFTDAGKPGFLVRTGDASQAAGVCTAGERMGLSTILKNANIDAFRVGCP